MGVFKGKEKTKRVVLANANVENYKGWDGMSLGEVDEKVDIKNVLVGISTNPSNGDEYTSLIIELKDKKVAFPLSRKLSEDTSVLEDEDMLPRLTFSVRNKRGVNDNEGDYDNYTGAAYISIGLPAELTFEERSLVKAEPVGKE